MNSQNSQSQNSFVADSLAVGMLIMLVMTVIQRGLGFLRNLWFCRLLDDATVGQWSLAYDFITMITPVMLLGMPGALPRYVEHYRQLGHLGGLVKRLLAVTSVLGALFFALLMMRPTWFGWLVFLEPQRLDLIYSVGVAVVAIIAFNFVYQLVSSLRQVIVISWMQFIQSIGFTIGGICWLIGGGQLVGLVYVYAAATLLAIAPGAYALCAGWRGLPQSNRSFDAPSMWRRILPFAISLWVMNLLANLFAMSDRLMILHWLPAGNGQAAVGQYHSSRIIPLLLMSIASMIAGILLPYLSADWESGRYKLVRLRLRQILLAVALLFTLVGAASLLIGPWLFSEVLQGRYADGLTLMPLAFVCSIWVALAGIGQTYLWVAEKGKWVGVAIGVGFLANIVLNLLLMPVWGLTGAVAATTTANGIVLIGLWVAMDQQSYGLDVTAVYATVLPLFLLASPYLAIVASVVIPLTNPPSRAWLRSAVSVAVARLPRRAVAVSSPW